jgi:predicted transcriptional regulator
MSIPTESAKQHLITILQQQPEDSSYDELLRELAFARMIDRGMRDADAGRIVSNDEISREIASWRNQK